MRVHPRKCIRREYVSGSPHSRCTVIYGKGITQPGKGITQPGTGHQTGGNIFKELENFGKNIVKQTVKAVTSKPFKQAVRWTRQNVATPVFKSGLPLLIDKGVELASKNPVTAVAANLAADPLKKLSLLGVDELNKIAAKNGYGKVPPKKMRYRNQRQQQRGRGLVDI